MNLTELEHRIFNIDQVHEFNDIALKIFQFQYTHNPVYRAFVDFQVTNISKIEHYSQIPFLPIEFFKTHQIICEGYNPQITFESSGTTGNQASRHHIARVKIYEESFLKGFELFYGKPSEFIFLALLPAYLERTGSSLVYMVDQLIRKSDHPSSNFFLNNLSELKSILVQKHNRKVILIGVSFALLDLAEQFELEIPGVIVMETGGMKGRRKEMIRVELHQKLKEHLNIPVVHSEYGMTELLSQAYSKRDGIFNCPPWMKILIRDMNDPKTIMNKQQTGGINVIDLANIYSCSFIATQDLGKMHADGSFEVLGRFDNSDIRGCNLMVV
ncbi:MAG: acyltransferase [Bacteroidales bacterium]|nr:acyltransferase [Bacteroidales bacterium]